MLKFTWGACNCGTGLDSFAQELANVTGVEVIAVEGTGMARKDSKKLIFQPKYTSGKIKVYSKNKEPELLGDGKSANVPKLAEETYNEVIKNIEEEKVDNNEQ